MFGTVHSTRKGLSRTGAGRTPRLCVLGQDLADGPGVLRLQLVEELHRLEDAERLADLDPVALLHERRRRAATTRGRRCRPSGSRCGSRRRPAGGLVGGRRGSPAAAVRVGGGEADVARARLRLAQGDAGRALLDGELGRLGLVEQPSISRRTRARLGVVHRRGCRRRSACPAAQRLEQRQRAARRTAPRGTGPPRRPRASRPRRCASSSEGSRLGLGAACASATASASRRRPGRAAGRTRRPADGACPRRPQPSGGRRARARWPGRPGCARPARPAAASPASARTRCTSSSTSSRRSRRADGAQAALEPGHEAGRHAVQGGAQGHVRARPAARWPPPRRGRASIRRATSQAPVAVEPGVEPEPAQGLGQELGRHAVGEHGDRVGGGGDRVGAGARGLDGHGERRPAGALGVQADGDAGRRRAGARSARRRRPGRAPRRGRAAARGRRRARRAGGRARPGLAARRRRE